MAKELAKQKLTRTDPGKAYNFSSRFVTCHLCDYIFAKFIDHQNKCSCGNYEFSLLSKYHSDVCKEQSRTLPSSSLSSSRHLPSNVPTPSGPAFNKNASFPPPTGEL